MHAHDEYGWKRGHMNPINMARLSAVKALSVRVGQALKWSELEKICTDINMAFLTGEFSAEGLGALCVFSPTSPYSLRLSQIFDRKNLRHRRALM